MSPNTAFLAIYLQVLGIYNSFCMEPAAGNFDWTNCVLSVAEEQFKGDSVVVLIDFRHSHEHAASNEAAPPHLHRLAKGLHQFSRWSVISSDVRKHCHMRWDEANIAKFNFVHKVRHIFAGHAGHILSCVPHIPPGLFRHGCIFSAEKDKEKMSLYERNIHQISEVISKRQLNCRLIATTRNGTMNVYSWFNLDNGYVPLISDTCNNGTRRKNVQSSLDKALQHTKRDSILRVACLDTPPMLCKTKDGDFAGVELEPFKLLMAHYNLSMEFVESKPPEDCKLNQWEYALLLVEKGEADVSLGQFVSLENRMHNFRHSYPLYVDTVLWFVTKDCGYTSTAFNQIVFTELFILYVATACALRLISWSADGGLREDKSSALLTVWALFTEQPIQSVNYLSKKQSAFWVVAAFVALNVNVFRKSLEVASFNNVMYSQNISTLEDLINSDIPVVHNIPNNILGLETADFDRIRPRLVDCPDFPLCIRRLNVSRPFAVALFKTNMDFVQKLYPHTKDFFVELKDGEITGIHVNTYSRWNFPILNDLDRVMVRTHELGIFDYWKKKVLRESRCNWRFLESGQNYWSRVRHESAAKELRDSWVHKMSEDYILNAVKILLLGYLAAFFALLGELAYHVGVKRYLRRRRQHARQL